MEKVANLVGCRPVWIVPNVLIGNCKPVQAIFDLDGLAVVGDLVI